MEVSVIKNTSNPEILIYIAGKRCYSGEESKDLFNSAYTQKKTEINRFIRKLLENGHLSPLEHASITYAIDGISRACSHQLVRHRLASYSQQSQRYTKINTPEYVIPPGIAENPEAKNLFEEYLFQGQKLYTLLTSLGIKKEDARYIIPQAWNTKIIVTMNFRELLHFFKLRTDKAAQWEIRKMAERMKTEAGKICPVIFGG